MLHYAVHDIAMHEICRRGIEQIVAAIILPLLPDDRKQNGLEWPWDFCLRDIWELQSGEEDIALIIDRVVVMEDGTTEVHLI